MKRHDYLAEGKYQQVYRHPTNEALCVKVPRNGRDLDQSTIRDIQAWKQLKWNGCDFDRIPYYHGQVKTNRGSGAVWQLLSNTDGSPAITLLAAMGHQLVDPVHCRQRLLEYGNWAIEHRVIGCDLHARNLVCQFDAFGDFKIAIVDGWENSERIPISNWSRLLGRMKTRRRWLRFLTRFDSGFAEDGSGEYDPTVIGWET